MDNCDDGFLDIRSHMIDKNYPSIRILDVRLDIKSLMVDKNYPELAFKVWYTDIF